MKTAAHAFHSLSFLRRSGVASMMLISVSLNATPLDDESQPPPTDPSAYYTPPADPVAAAAELDAIKTLPEANQGSIALPNGVFGNRDTPRAENILPP